MAFMQYAKRLKSYYQIFIASIISTIFLYWFPGAMIRPIAISLNYLWPIPLILLYIYVFKRELFSKEYTLKKLVFLSFLGFFSGFTQEVYVLPLCISSFIILVIRLIRERRLSLNIILLSGWFWIGAALVGLAPGTLERGNGLATSSFSALRIGIEMLAGQDVFLLALIALFGVTIWRKSILSKLKFELSLLIWAVLFGIVAHTTNQSFSGVQFFSLIIVIKFLIEICSHTSLFSSKVLNCSSFGIVLLMIAHQCLISLHNYPLCVRNHKIVEDYISSTNGIVEYEDVQYNPLTKPFIRDFVPILGNSEWQQYTIKVAYGNEDKEIILLPKTQSLLLDSIISGVEYNEKNSRFTKVGNYYFAIKDSVLSKGDSLSVTLL